MPKETRPTCHPPARAPTPRRTAVSSKQLLRRIGLGILTLWLVSLVVFAAGIALPGDAPTAILGKTATPARVAALREQLHLNESVVTQYLQWLKGILPFDFGN